MTPEEYQARSLYEQLQPGDRVEVIHGVTVGSSATWNTTTVGQVLRRERRRHGLQSFGRGNPRQRGPQVRSR